MPAVENAMCVWDFTIHFPKIEVNNEINYELPQLPEGKGPLNEDALTEILKEKSKKRVFQLEKGDLTGCVHYQGRVNLQRTYRTRTPWKIFPEFKGHWTPTSLESTKGDAFYNYCTKDHTRIGGPWSDKDDVTPVYVGNAVKVLRGEKTYNKPIYHDDGSTSFAPEKYDGLQPWMNKIVELVQIPDFRTIHCVVDEIGCHAKSFLVKHMRDALKPHFVRVPGTMETADKMMNFCCDSIHNWADGVQGVFALDLPRAMKEGGPKEMATLCTALEEMKNGEFYNWKYKAKTYSIENPGIVIFSNFYPGLAISRNLLSRDKWQFWTICKDSMKLIRYKYTPSPKAEGKPKKTKRSVLKSVLAAPDESDDEFFTPAKRRCLIVADDEP